MSRPDEEPRFLFEGEAGTPHAVIEGVRRSRYFLAVLGRQSAPYRLGFYLSLGAAVLHDKPIYLVVQKGAALPERLARLAREVVWYESADDIGRLATELARRMKEEEAG